MRGRRPDLPHVKLRKAQEARLRGDPGKRNTRRKKQTIPLPVDAARGRVLLNIITNGEKS